MLFGFEIYNGRPISSILNILEKGTDGSGGFWSLHGIVSILFSRSHCLRLGESRKNLHDRSLKSDRRSS